MGSAQVDPGLLKLDLLCRGALLGGDVAAAGARPVRRTRAGLGSGLEVVLPGGMWVNVPVEEPFAAGSAYRIEITGKGGRRGHRGGVPARLHREGGPAVDVTLPLRPHWSELRTTSGRPMDEVATLQGTHLAVYASRVCDFWLGGGARKCRYCAVGVSGDGVRPASVDEVVEAARAAKKESRVTYVDINVGHHEDEGHVDVLEAMAAAITRETGLLVGVQMPPVGDPDAYRRLRGAGVNRISFCPEVVDPEAFRRFCPGKSRRFDWDGYMDAIRACVPLFDTTNGELIAGLESETHTIRGLREIAAAGAVPTVAVFRPLIGTDLEDHPSPRTDDMIPVFRALYEACMEYGLPIGIAPRVQVSLVLLAEEAAGLSPRAYPLGRARLACRRAVFRAAWRLRSLACGFSTTRATTPVE